MAPPAPTPAGLEAALAACMNPDAAARSAGEAAAAAAAKTPSHIAPLATVAASAADPSVRQLAFQQLRKALTRNWKKASVAAKKAATDACLAALDRETVPGVRRQAAAAAAAAAAVALPKNEWPGLWEWASAAGVSPNEHHREAALEVLAQTASLNPAAVSTQAAGLAAAARKGLADPAPRVVGAAVELLVAVALGEGAGPADAATAAAVKAASGDLFTAADRLLAAGDADRFAEACEAAAELAECPAPVFGPSPADAAAWAVAHARDRAASRTARAAPLLVLEALARGKPKQLAKAGGNVVAGAVTALCELIAEPVAGGGGGGDASSDDEEDEDGETPVPTLAAQALDVLALELPAKAVLQPALAFAQAAMAAGADNPRARRAGCVALLVVAEGCSDALRPVLPAALAIVAAGLRDPLPTVRGQAAFALGQLAEHCTPEMAAHIGSALPPVLELLAAAPRGTAAQQACYALEVLCDSLDEGEVDGADVLAPHLPALVPALVGALAGGDTETRHSALGALASAAAASGSGFAAHAPAVLPALSHFMQAGGEPGSDEVRLRARATEAAGVVASTLGRDGAAPLLNEMVPVMIAGLAIPDSELREYTHAALANVAGLVGPGVSPLLPTVVPAAVASLQADDGADLGEDDEGGAGSPAGASGESLDSDDDEDDESDDDSADLAVRTGVLDEKVAAAHALGAYASAAGAAFAPHAGPALAALRVAARHFHDDLREAAYAAMGELAKVGAAVAGGSDAAPAGRVGGPPPGPAAVAAASELLPPLAAAIVRDPDAGAAASAAAAAAEAVLALGTAAAPHAGALSASVAAVLKGEARAQSAGSDDESDGGDGGGADSDADSDDGGEAEAHLLACAAELLPALARALGPDAYAPLFEGGHAGPLAARARADQPEEVRSAAVGAFADVALVLGARAAGPAAAMLPAILKELRSPSETSRRNAAYAVGAAAGAAPAALAPHARAVLEALGAALADSSADGGLRENAAGAVARLALALPPGTVPLDQALPALLAMLPPAGPGFAADPGEAAPVLNLCGAVAGSAPGSAGPAEACVPGAAAALAAAASDGSAPRPVRAAAARGLAAAAAARPDVGGPLVAGLAPDVRAELEALAAEAGPVV